MSTIYYCATCGKETNYAVSAYTSCSECKKKFCCAMWSPCFAEHSKECKGSHLTITNPQWVVNLRVSKSNDATAKPSAPLASHREGEFPGPCDSR